MRDCFGDLLAEGSRSIAIMENFRAVVDSRGICYLLTWWRNPYLIGPEDLARLLEAATGKSMSRSELLKMGERIHNIEKTFNARVGMTRKDDRPPDQSNLDLYKVSVSKEINSKKCLTNTTS